MSRIQNILDKAEREGTVRRMRGADTAAAAVALDAEAPAAVSSPPATVIDTIGPAAIQPATPVRVVTGARLDRRLLSATAADPTVSTIRVNS